MSETVTQTPGAPGSQGTALPADAVVGSLVTDLGKTPEPTTLVTDAKDPTAVSRDTDPAKDPAKNVDGTDKTAEQIAAEAKAEADKNAVPEKYEIKFGDKDADPAMVEAFTPVAKELGLTNDQAQKLATFHQEQVDALLASQTKVQGEAWAGVQKEWVASARADTEFGHLAGGKTFDENGALIAKGLATFGTPELNKALIDSGMGNHPEVARFFYRVGKAVSEDTIRVGASVGNGGAPKSLADRIFPNHK